MMFYTLSALAICSVLIAIPVSHTSTAGALFLAVLSVVGTAMAMREPIITKNGDDQ